MRKLDNEALKIEINEADMKRRAIVAALRHQSGETVPQSAEVLAYKGLAYVAVHTGGEQPAHVYRVHRVSKPSDENVVVALRVMKRPPVPVRQAVGIV